MQPLIRVTEQSLGHFTLAALGHRLLRLPRAAIEIGQTRLFITARRIERRALSAEPHQRRVEIRRFPARRRRPAARIEPREEGQQQPRIMPPPRGDLLAAMKHRFLHPVERAFGQHRLDMVTRQQQRRIPAARKGRIAPPRAIGGLRRNPHGRAGRPD
ncbi:hypothetical protein [Altericroceibacterium endophyticum]|uniref:Uncharacterized protein n=1 Tax=Altericroceibacterium endophyticum TaxID=1808508 RepID=A0A6I4T690_9SPHN|nr:hypothetical protein [Altericroceibacterium endophyticum]MXO66357.1 hypothetical protein [Altericroceibacterium endophyticum]